MKILGILFRLIYSLLILIALSIYAQATPGVSLEAYSLLITPDTLIEMFTTINWVSVLFIILIVLACFRILDMVWNVLFCLSTILVTVCSLYLAFGSGIALPTPLDGNKWMELFCNLPQHYPVPTVIVTCVFAIGWLIATASLRIAITSLISYALWYICSEMFHYIVYLWSEAPHPAMPEVLHTLQAAPWIAAAIPGAFFLIYALVMSFFETFISRKEEEQEEEAEQAIKQKKQEKEKKNEEAQKAEKLREAAKHDKPQTPFMDDSIPPEAEGLPIGRDPKTIIPPEPLKHEPSPTEIKKEEPTQQPMPEEEPKKEEHKQETEKKEEPPAENEQIKENAPAEAKN